MAWAALPAAGDLLRPRRPSASGSAHCSQLAHPAALTRDAVRLGSLGQRAADAAAICSRRKRTARCWGHSFGGRWFCSAPADADEPKGERNLRASPSPASLLTSPSPPPLEDASSVCVCDIPAGAAFDGSVKRLVAHISASVADDDAREFTKLAGALASVLQFEAAETRARLRELYRAFEPGAGPEGAAPVRAEARRASEAAFLWAVGELVEDGAWERYGSRQRGAFAGSLRPPRPDPFAKPVEIEWEKLDRDLLRALRPPRARGDGPSPSPAPLEEAPPGPGGGAGRAGPERAAGSGRGERGGGGRYGRREEVGPQIGRKLAVVEAQLLRRALAPSTPSPPSPPASPPPSRRPAPPRPQPCPPRLTPAQPSSAHPPRRRRPARGGGGGAGRRGAAAGARAAEAAFGAYRGRAAAAPGARLIGGRRPPPPPHPLLRPRRPRSGRPAPDPAPSPSPGPGPPGPAAPARRRLVRRTLLDGPAEAGVGPLVRWLLAPTPLEEPTFERVLLLYRYAPPRPARTPALLRRLLRRGELAGGGGGEGQAIHLRVFRDVPVVEVEGVLPVQKLVFRAGDLLKLDFTALLGLLAAAVNLRTELLDPYLELLGVAGLSLYATRTFINYRNASERYRREQLDTLLNKSLAVDAAALADIADAAARQSTAEALVAYAALWDGGRCAPLDGPRLQAACSAILRDALGVEAEFRAEAAVETLLRLGLAHAAPSGRTVALPVEIARDQLRRVWRSFV
eukprot:tig00001408_g8597.t1